MANPTWFDTAHYKAQKLAQLQATDTNGAWTPTKLDEVLAANGFAGAEGAFAHFTAYGSDEHCTPNAAFNAAEYLAAKLVQLEKTDNLWVGKTLNDVQAALAKAGLGEWEHYQLYGSKEGVNPSNAFDESAYYDAKLAQLIATDATNWTGKNAIDVRDALQAAGLSALEHFLMFGKGENLAAPAVPADEQVTVPSGFYIFGGQGGMPSVGLELTRGTDNLTGTAGNDSFFAASADGFPTLNPSDTLNGGAGDDTLFIGTNAGSANFAAASIKGIENVVTYGNVDVSANADVQNLTVMAGGEGTAKMAQNVTLQDAAHNYGLTAKFVDATGKEDAVTVNVKNNTNMDSLTVNSIEKLTLNLTGKNVDNVDNRDAAINFDAGAVKEFIVTGEGSIKLEDATASGDIIAANFSNLGALESLDFSANKGGVEMAFNSNVYAKAVTVKGGAGDDKITYFTSTANTSKVLFDVDMGAGNDTFEVVEKIHKDAKFNGGEGSDTLVLNGVVAADMTLDFANHFSNFENVTLKGGTASAHASFVNSYFKGISKATIIGDASFIDVTDLGTLTVTDGTTNNAAAVSHLGVSAKALDLTFDNMEIGKPAGAGIAVATLSLTNTTDLAIHSSGYVNSDNALAKITETTPKDLDTITITGDQNFTLGGTAIVATGLGKIDGSAFTGELTVDLRATASSVEQGLKVIGGEGDDTFVTSTGSANTDENTHIGWGVKLTGGEGDDTFNVTLSAVIADPASDLTSSGGPTDAHTWASRAVTITDFTKGDTIRFASGSYTEIDAASKHTYTTVEGDLEDLCNNALASGSEIRWFTDKTDSYIVLNTGAASSYSGDVIVKIAGVTDLSGISINDTGELTWA